MRLFGNPGRRFALDATAAKRVFQKEFNLALDALEDEREQATIRGYEFGDFETFLDVHEEVYSYLAETNCTDREIDPQAWAERVAHLDQQSAELAYGQLSSLSAIWHQSLDETAAALESEQLGTDIFHMDHAMRLRFEARLAAVQEYRRRMNDPKLRFDSLLAAPPVPVAAPVLSAPAGQPAPTASAGSPLPAISPDWAGLTAEQMAQKFIDENPTHPTAF